MDNLIATGFLRMGPDSTNDRSTNSVEDRLDVIADEMDVIGSGILYSGNGAGYQAIFVTEIAEIGDRAGV